MEYLHDHHPAATYFHKPFTGRSGLTRSGYGKKIPTNWMVRIGNRTHRVYCMIWSNAGTLWVRIKGKQFIFMDCYHKQEDAR